MMAIATSLTLLLSLALPPQDDQGRAIVETEHHYVLNFADADKDDNDQAMTLETFVEACQEATDLNFTYSDETAALLSNAKVRLLGEKKIAKDEFYNFFQIMMIINDFVCSKVGPDHMSVIEVESLKTQARNTMKQNAKQIDPENLEEYADQPATLITTVLHLPNTDVRQLSNSMRTMLTDANTQQMLPAGNTDSMILTGFGSNVVALARMLRLVDEASKVEEVFPVFEVIPLEYAGADELSATIEELLDASQRAQSGRTQQAQGPTGAQRSGRTETKIMVDPRTNSLLVMAMPEDMPRIQELVARLDVDVIDRERSYHIYLLDNVSAEDLADTLNEFLQDASRLEASRSGQGATGRPGGAAATSRSNEFVVVPDPETNSLLIAASHTRYQELETLIHRLDTRQPQVLIETALIELSTSDFVDIGLELGLSNIPGVGQSGGFGVTAWGLSTLSDQDGDGFVDTRIPTQANGITGGILNGDDFNLPALIRMVEEKRNSNVLNVPSVLVNNNGTATVVSKDEQPTTTTTLTGAAGGSQQDFDQYVEAGITMQISPSISASNYLRLSIYLEVSTFTGTVSGPIPPAKVTRTIETQVNVPDGDTMVIGGLIIDNSRETVNQIPWLGDIPIIGALFRRNSVQEDRTALYFFVTPHILDDELFADLSEISYTKKQEAADSIGRERVRQVDPNFGRNGAEVDLAGFDLPLYKSPKRGVVDPQDVGLDDPQRINELLEAGRESQEEKQL